MSARAVVLPAAPLLVPGAAGVARPLEATRRTVLAALGRVRTPRGVMTARWGVLAPADGTTWGARTASLAAAGIADRWVPSLPSGVGTVAGVPASVALWALGAAAGAAAVAGAVVVELAGRPQDDDEARAVDALGGLDGLIVAGGTPGDPGTGPSGPAPSIARVLDLLADVGGWDREVTRVVEEGAHLPGTYEIVVWSAAQSPANQPTPVSSSQNRTVRPTSTVGT